MTAEEYRRANLDIAITAEMIESMPLDEVLSAQSKADALGPIMDPTLYRDKAKDFQIDHERTRILRVAQIELKKLRAKHT